MSTTEVTDKLNQVLKAVDKLNKRIDNLYSKLDDFNLCLVHLENKFNAKLGETETSLNSKADTEAVLATKTNSTDFEEINDRLITNKSKKAETPNRLIVGNREVTDKFMMSETFNQQFISIGKKLADNINNTPNSFYKFLPKRESTSIYFEPPRYNEVYNIIHSLKINKSTGHDNVDAYFIRISCDLITPYLTQLCDFSFEFGLLPECLKIAKVVPIFKNGSKNDINNYRPISLLSNFSKIMEKLIASRLMNFLEQRCVLHENQYGFRKKMSTTHAIIDVVNQISSNINKKKLTGLVFLDLKKAFDTVSHEILL